MVNVFFNITITVNFFIHVSEIPDDDNKYIYGSHIFGTCYVTKAYNLYIKCPCIFDLWPIDLEMVNAT